MQKYTVSIVAKISGVTIRTLQHYDKIGLLKPFERARSGYRYYTKDELYRLQQILFFKDPTFDLEEALSYQRQTLEQRKTRLDLLLNTIDKTIQRLKEENKMITDEELYEGFSDEEILATKKEVDEKYDSKMVAESYSNIKKMSKKEFSTIKEEQENIAKELALIMDQAIDSKVVQGLIKRHHTTNERFYTTNAKIYKGLADMYVSDSRFTEFYDKHKAGLAKFLREAMYYFANNSL